MNNEHNYKIKDYTYRKAKHIGLDVYPSKRKNYKIDIYHHGSGEYICSVGDKRYSDYPTYIETKGIEYANKRRDLYKARHHKEANKVGTRGWFAYHLLW
jgi:hypothetical protein